MATATSIKTAGTGDRQAPSKGERTAARIREIALDQFSRLGFERVTMGGIAEAAGVSQPTLHHHFEGKRQLWESAMLELSAVIDEESRLMTAAQDASAVVQLRMAMRLFLEVSRRHPALGRIVALEGMAGGERLDWLNRHLLGRRNRALVNLARAAIDDGDLKSFPAELVIVSLQAGAAGMLNLGPMMQSTFRIDVGNPRVLAAHEEIVIDGLLDGFLTDKGRTAFRSNATRNSQSTKGRVSTTPGRGTVAASLTTKSARKPAAAKTTRKKESR